jgi:hypothetical protein
MGFSRGMIASGVAALALVVGGCKGDSGASAPKQAGTATGEVVSVKYDEVVLKPQGADKQLRLAVDPATQVMMDGRFIMAERLSENTLVRATYDASGKATRIEVLPKGGGTSDASGQTGGAPTGPAAPHASGAPGGSPDAGAAAKK